MQFFTDSDVSCAQSENYAKISMLMWDWTLADVYVNSLVDNQLLLALAICIICFHIDENVNLWYGSSILCHFVSTFIAYDVHVPW